MGLALVGDANAVRESKKPGVCQREAIVGSALASHAICLQNISMAQFASHVSQDNKLALSARQEV